MSFIAYNAALSTTTAVGAGTSVATGSKCLLQLNIPDSGMIELVEWGWTQDIPTATSSLVEIASTDTATTGLTTHTTTTIKPLHDPAGNHASRLTMGTSATGYGAVAIASNTTLRNAAHLYVPTAYVFQWPLGQYPRFGNGSSESFVQLRCNTSATVNVLCWMVWNEYI